MIRHAGNVVAGSCGVASLFFFLVYLAATPNVADLTETYYQVHYKRMMNPQYTWKEMEEASEQIRSDESVMAKLNAEIEERNRQIAGLDS